MTETTKGTERELPAGWRSAEIGDVCQVNPRRPVLGQRPEAATSFVPMAAVDAVHGRVAGMQKRPFGEVEKGYTYFEEGDVLFAKITPCMQNGKHAVARGLVGGYGHEIRIDQAAAARMRTAIWSGVIRRRILARSLRPSPARDVRSPARASRRVPLLILAMRSARVGAPSRSASR